MLTGGAWMSTFRRGLLVVAGALCCALGAAAQFAGQNINMVSGTDWPAGDPYLQRQNEPSMAVSSRNPEHLLGGANDYRTVDIPNPLAPTILGDAWVGVYSSLDGGETWKSTLLPGYPQDQSAVGKASPLHNFTVATDPTVRAGTHGLFYYSGLVFNRGAGTPSGVFVATLQDLNNKGNGDAPILMSNGNGGTHGNPFSYINAVLVDSGNSGQFLDKPWIAVDVPRPGRTATCKINGQTISSGYVYVVYTQFNGSQNNPSSKIKVATSTNCGASWGMPQILSQSEKLAQGTVAAIDPTTGNVVVAWRQIASSNGSQPDAIQYAISTNGGNSFSSPPPVHTFVAPTTSNPYPAGAVFDQPQATNTTFRSLDVPALAVDATGRTWLAYSQRVNGPIAKTYGSRIMVTTLPKGSSTWTTPYVADSTAPSTPQMTTYGFQFMPSFSFAYGKLALAWFDSRRDNLQSVLNCPTGPGNCTSLGQLQAVDQPIPGSTISDPTTVFGPLISDPTTGIRHTIDIFGGVINPSIGPQTFKGFQISQYPYYTNQDDKTNPNPNAQLQQGFFNPPNLPMFVQGTTPFLGDYIDIAAQTILPSGNSWIFNTATDTISGATNAPDFHVTWTDNRDVVAPPVVNSNQDWTQYVPPNGGNAGSSTYSGTGTACPGCVNTQPACAIVTADGGGSGAYTGDRNQNVYTSRITNGLVVRFKENAKQPNASVTQRAFSLLVKNTISPLNANPIGSPTYYRIMLGVTSTSPASNQVGSCSKKGGTAPAYLSPSNSCYLDVTVNPLTTLTQAVVLTASASVNVLVSQIQGIPATGTNPVFINGGLQALAVINADPTNPSVADPDFLTYDNSNPDLEGTPSNQLLPIASGEEYDPTVDAPPDPSSGIFTPKIGVPAIFTPKIGSVANSAPAIDTPTIFTPKITSIFTPKIVSQQIANPTIVNTIFTPKIFTPKIFTPKIASPDIFTPKITSLSDSGSSGLTDYTWKVNNKGNTSSSFNTSEFIKSSGVSCCPASCSANPNTCSVTSTNPAGPNCSVCQLVQHKVYESPTVNRDASNLNATCDATVQQTSVVVANIPDPAFSADSGVGSAADPTNSTLALSPGEGNRVTLRVMNAPQTGEVSSFKTQASSFVADTGKSTPSSSLIITTDALPVAVVGQPYFGATLSALGGVTPLAWSVPTDPTLTNIVAVPLPISPETLPVSPLTLNQSGMISSGGSNVTSNPGSYTVNVQTQDAAGTPSLDVQQIPLQVNQFTISSVDPVVVNQVGSTGYMKAGDAATVTVMINNQGPATATSVTPTLTVNAVAGGTSNGPTPVVNCGAAVGASTIPGNTIGTFTYTCTATSGNGYVSFTANANGQYVNSAAAVTAIATPVSEPSLTPSGTPPNIIVDTVIPSLLFASASPAPVNGWNNTPVQFAYTVSDNLSGVKTSPPSPLILSKEGKNLTGTVALTDYANNSQTFTAPTPPMPAVNIDMTPPTIAGLATPAANANGWNNTTVTVQFTCADPNPTNGPAGQQSGIGSCTAPIALSTEAANQSAKGTATDVAGNSTITTISPINIDKTLPTATTFVASPAVPGTGWYNASTPSVSFTYLAGDALSGVDVSKTTLSPVAVIGEGSAVTAPLMVTDKAGNVYTTTTPPIQVDRTAPTINVSSTYVPGTWTNQSVTVQFTCTDTLSGAQNPVITSLPAMAGTVTYTQPMPLTTMAAVVLTAETKSTTLTANCQDVAGNPATAVQFGPVQIDKTPPAISASAMAGGAPYTAGTWTNQSVVVTFACTDTLSGVKPGFIMGTTTYAAQGSYNAQGTCQDLAGNSANLSYGPVQIDTSTPAVMITSPSAQTYILNQTITPNFTCSDNSGGDTTTCTATPSAAPYAATPVGPATFSVHAVDQAGNATNPDPSVNYLVIYNFTGFQAPLQPAVMMNPVNPASPPKPSDSGSFTIGTTVPIAWQMQDAAPNYITDPSTITSIVAIPNPACAGAATGTGTTLYNATTGQSAFSYDNPNNRFLFNWDTTGSTAGCYNVVVTTNDTAQWSTIVHLATDTFTGFDAPLTNAAAPASPSNSGTFDTGSTIPVMWQLNIPSGGLDSTPNIGLTNVTAYSNAACSGAPQAGASSTVVYDSASKVGSFSFEPTSAVYTVNWATGATAAGCYDIVVTLSDQSVYSTMVTLAAPGQSTTLLQYNFDNVPQGTQSIPASFAAPTVTGGALAYSGTNNPQTFSNGCVLAECIDPVPSATAGEYYSFSLTNTAKITSGSISLAESNDDCQAGPGCVYESFKVQYSTTSDFSAQVTYVGTFTPTSSSANYSFQFPGGGPLQPNTYYFRITTTGSGNTGNANYALDNVTITGTD